MLRLALVLGGAGGGPGCAPEPARDEVRLGERRQHHEGHDSSEEPDGGPGGAEGGASSETQAGEGAFVIFTGDDADDQGHCQGTRCGRLFQSLFKEALARSRSGGTGILALGVNGGSARVAFDSWNAVGNGGPGAPVTHLTDPADILTVDFNAYALIYLPSTSNNTNGGRTPEQIAAINKRRDDLGKFLNVRGGALIGLTGTGASGGNGYIPVTFVTWTMSFSRARPTPELVALAPLATEANLTHNSFHNVFSGPEGYSGMRPLIINADPASPGYGFPTMVGGANVIFTVEFCDDGRDNDNDGKTDYLDEECWRCGNGHLDPGEQCDDGSNVNGDGCNEACRFEGNQPPVAVCGSLEVCTDVGLCVATVSGLGAGSFDPEGGPVSITPTPAGPYSLGAQQVQVRVSDGQREATCEASLLVKDCEAPSLVCPAPLVVECTGNQGARVTPGTATVTDACGPAAVTGPPEGHYPLGTTPVTYSAVDGAGNQATCASTLQVVDSSGPVVTVKGLAPVWPPSKKPFTVSLADCGAEVRDACGGALDLTTAHATITCVTSDEPPHTRGKGTRPDDIAFVNATTVTLKRERLGAGDGRVYELHFQVSDAAGNVATGVCPVAVPRSVGATTVDSGDAYRVCRP